MSLTAKRIRKRSLRRGNGLETLVDVTAIVVFILGSLIAIVLLLTFSLWGLLAAGSQLLGAFIGWLLLRCLAEHLRLQKKIAGVHFEGHITRAMEQTIWACSNCGQLLHADDRCESCGAQIEPDES